LGLTSERRDSTLLLVFLAAAASSSFACAVLKAASPASRTAALKAGQKFLHSKEQGLVAVVLGAASIGMGMAVSGACPSLIYAQIGSGQPVAFVTMAGALVGAAAAAVAGRQLASIQHIAVFESRTLEQLLGFSELFTAILIVIGAACVITVVHVLPGVYNPLPGAESVVSWQYWHPVLGGVMIGATQVPLTLGMGRNLGASSSFAWMIQRAAAAVGFKQNVAATGAWQVIFVTCVAAGAALGAAMSGVFPQGDAWHVEPWEAFLGGFLQLFGSRLASGCAVGHGVTGLGQGSMISAAAAAAMFGAGTVVGVLGYSDLVHWV
jgi:uncharacterized membrane protein YedE/YeeE